MKYFHYMTVEVFVHATEEKEKVVEAVRNILGEDAFSASSFEETYAEGYHKNPIGILRWTLRSSSRAGSVLKRVMEEVGEELFTQIEDRVDDEGVLHIRLDKMKAYRGEIALARGREPVVLRFKIASYPRGREGAVRTLRRFIGPDG
ncbi:MAG: hypothetical protein J7K08_04850 [Thermoplasmata archaeon]|nr:hypothetical protein [Thermoplasmata archaeon]RLF71785.1 MAG: hypothetical protein DRN40_01735 [Thermoplasmata archaeon]